ncbi:DUF6316 family protein [Teredinibacter purpureus]|uniref:DUF6316 family protein n=1 Tax=Teredinibacter purpureus TaxID=2731756 RepID=UPI0005F7816A|nr:DUF6316 family protein [Teredinibacter purpureus]
MVSEVIRREGEEDKVWYRTERCFRIGTDWYIATREEGDIGPFGSRTVAERSVPRYVNIMKDEGEAGTFAKKLAIQGVWAATHFT